MSHDRDYPQWPLEAVLSAHTRALEQATDAVRTSTIFDDRLESMAEVDVGTTPSEVVYTENKLELHRYESLTEDQHEIPILIVYALINRPYILDLQSDRSVIRRLLEAGHDVYMIDWKEPSRLDQHLDLYDYVERYVGNCVDVVRERSGREAINVLGYCMGGTMSTIYTAWHPDDVNALALMAPPLYFENSGEVLEHWGNEDYFDPRVLTETFGTVPGEFFDQGFALMDPIDNSITKYITLFEHLENEDFVENYARMETWLDDSVDLAGEAYAEFLEGVYQSNSLYENELCVGGRHVDVTNIDMPVLQILGQYDHLVPPTASKPFADVVGSDDVTIIEYPTGHIGLAVSNSAHSDVWPEVAEWFLDQSERPGLADVVADGIEETLDLDVETDVTVGNVDDVELAIADEEGLLDRETVEHDVDAVANFLEDALDVDLGIETGPASVAIEVDTGEARHTTVVENVGEATRSEIRESVSGLDVAATYDLEDVRGIGPTYAGRLREAGIDSVGALAVADPADVAVAADATEDLAREWIDGAESLTVETSDE